MASSFLTLKTKLSLLRPAARFFSAAASRRGFSADDVDRDIPRFGFVGPQDPYSSTGRHVDYEGPFSRPPFISGTRGPYSSTGHVNYEGPFTKPGFDSTPNDEEYDDHEIFGWDFAMTKEGINLRFAMAGFDKDGVKVKVNNNTLIIKGKGEGIRANAEESQTEYKALMVLPEGELKLDQVKAVMKDGMLTVMLPKLKEEEKADVFSVEVE